MGYKEKLCEKCGQPYLPSGPRQRFCKDCRPPLQENGINALRVAVAKQAQRDGAFERMVENGVAETLFPEIDVDYMRRMLTEELKKPAVNTTSFTPIEDVWSELMAGGKVLAINLDERSFTDLQDSTVASVVEVLKDENTIYYKQI